MKIIFKNNNNIFIQSQNKKFLTIITVTVRDVKKEKYNKEREIFR